MLVEIRLKAKEITHAQAYLPLSEGSKSQGTRITHISHSIQFFF